MRQGTLRRLEALRESRCMTKSRLAEVSGLSATYIALLENGVKSPTLATLEKLAAALHVSVSELLDEKAV
ncbi:MAG: helix-turn-helix domain-containing protein [Acidaminococcales bacterium]|nr:helix-turn-helix domain-containing protein [Acidaminococcales bacterium]